MSPRLTQQQHRIYKYMRSRKHISEPQIPGGIPHLVRSQRWMSALFLTVEGEKVRREHSESIKDPWRELSIQSHQDKVQDLTEGCVGSLQCLHFSVSIMAMPRGHATSQTSPHEWFSQCSVCKKTEA